MQIQNFFITPLTPLEAEAIVAWHYPPPYHLYNVAPDEQTETIAYFLNPDNRCFAIRDTNDTFLGYASLGADAQVPGGDYSLNALDLGIGIRPDLTGRGEGKRFLAALVAFAETQVPPPEHLRVTVAGFNERAQRLVRGGGFAEVQRFARPKDGLEFVVLVR
jgi:ribosomal-protein-alanine N-acetyltransferase